MSLLSNQQWQPLPTGEDNNQWMQHHNALKSYNWVDGLDWILQEHHAVLINHLWMDVVLRGAKSGSWDWMGHRVRFRTPYSANKRKTGTWVLSVIEYS